MFTAYFDASRSKNKRVTTMVGFVSRDSKWERFDAQWQSLLDATGTGVTLFHMTDFVSSRKGWQSWKGRTDERRCLVQGLIACIGKNTNKGVAISLSSRDYDSMNSRRRLAEELGEEYAVCAFGCMGKIDKWASKKGINSKHIRYVFENGDGGQGAAIEKLRSWGFNAISEDKSTIRRFDPSDLAAWKARAIIDDALFRKDVTDSKERDFLKRSLTMLDPILHFNGWCTPASLTGICSALKIPAR